MSEDNYTIYANKPESYGRCGDSFWSDTIFAFELGSDDVLDIVTRCMVNNLDLSEGEKGWEIVILFDGHPISQDERDGIYALATPRAQNRIDDYNTEQKRIADEKKAKQNEDNEKLQRAMFESLKKKFEPSGL